MKPILLTLFLIAFSPVASADEGATEVARSHLGNAMKQDFGKLEASYAAEVQLLRGHEFLKDEYGLAEVGSRGVGAQVAREKLIAAMKKSVEGRPERPADKVAQMLESLTYAPVETGVGVVRIDGSDGVATPDGRLVFNIEEGDVLLKVSPPQGDFVLIHLRKVEDKWRVVAEYLD